MVATRNRAVRTLDSNIKPKPTARSMGLRRGLEILSLFDDFTHEWGVSDIAKLLGVQKSQAHRALKTMEDMGFLRRNPVTRKYRMGLRAFVLGAQADPLAASRPEIQRMLRRLSDEIEATVSLRIADGDDLLIVDWYEEHDSLPSHWPVGMRVPFNFGAGGKVFAATLRPDVVKNLFVRFGLPKYTDKSITDPKRFLAELDVVRKQGYAISDGENIAGSFSAAAPVVAPDASLKAVVVASRPAVQLKRADREAFVDAVVRTTKAMEAILQEQTASPYGRRGPKIQLV